MMRMESTVDSKELPQSNGQDKRIQELRAQVDSVKNVMAENVERMMERGERLDSIECRTEALQTNSANFKMTARKVQRKFCMLNAKWTFISAIVSILIITVLIVLILHWCGVIGKRTN